MEGMKADKEKTVRRANPGRRPVMFVLSFGAATAVMFALLLSGPVHPHVERFTSQLSSISAFFINALGGECSQTGAVLATRNGSFAIEVRDGCNGVNVVVLLWAAMIAWPANWKWKIVGFAGGLAAIQILNILRLISLYYLGQYSYQAFEFAHLYLWETLLMIDAIVVFGLWTRRGVVH